MKAYNINSKKQIQAGRHMSLTNPARCQNSYHRTMYSLYFLFFMFSFISRAFVLVNVFAFLCFYILILFCTYKRQKMKKEKNINGGEEPYELDKPCTMSHFYHRTMYFWYSLICCPFSHLSMFDLLYLFYFCVFLLYSFNCCTLFSSWYSFCASCSYFLFVSSVL